jgi:hypothetical protein
MIKTTIIKKNNKNTFHSFQDNAANPNVFEKKGVYNTNKCIKKGTKTPNNNHGFFHGCTTNNELSSDTADKAFNISIVTKTDNDID